jgi:dTDP-4-dehydrorhamnose 3,5-epimerase-like enzyme
MTATRIQFPIHRDENGVLCVYECGQQVPFDVQRVFTVSAKVGDTRGDHAHKLCTQLLVCVSGKIRVSCDDGVTVTLHYLDNMGDGLLIPPGVWAREEYVTDGAVLMVLCDRKYEADDYIREYREFRNYLGDKGL